MSEPWNRTYWNSERHCAYFALKELAQKLPHIDAEAGKTEWGTVIFRWVPSGEESPRYGYVPIAPSKEANHWNPDTANVPVPNGTEPWSVAHSHPNDTYFSNHDIEIARGERGSLAFKKRCTIYMVNKSGAYWADGRTGEIIDASANPRLVVKGQFPGFWS